MAEPPGVAGAQGGKVPNFASLSIANNRQPTTTNDIQTFRRYTIFLSRLISSAASSASQRPTFALLKRAGARKEAEAPFSDIFQPANMVHVTPVGRII